MQQIKLMSKLGLALIAITAISVSVATQAYYIQAADAQPKLPNNSVTSQTIVDGEVKTADLANDAVTSAKIKNGEVKAEDIATDAVTADEIAGFTGLTPAVCAIDGDPIPAHGVLVEDCSVQGTEGGDLAVASILSASPSGPLNQVVLKGVGTGPDEVHIAFLNTADVESEPFGTSVAIIVFDN
jgi:hypothetical protein